MYEELLEAAKTVDHIAHPLPLFYALSQAGRAIVAAHGVDGSVRGHGLAEGKVLDPITKMTVKPLDRPGLFGAVSAVLACPGLTGPAELGALWAALPDLADTPHGSDEWAPALFVWPLPPDEMLAQFVGEQAVVVFPSASASEAQSDLRSFLDRYPEAARIVPTGAPGVAGSILHGSPRGTGLLAWLIEDQADGTRIYRRVSDEIAEHRYTGEHWLIPRIGPRDDELPPLLLWWVLLFGLSLVARYEPAAWRAALDVETPLAVRLEDLLDEALEAVPHWILWALLGQPYRLPPRAARYGAR
jgi:hypothetical protein